MGRTDEGKLNSSDLQDLLNNYETNRTAIFEAMGQFIDHPEFDIHHVYDGWLLIHYAVYWRDEELILLLGKKYPDAIRSTTKDEAEDTAYHLLLRRGECSARIFSLVHHLASSSDERSEVVLFDQENAAHEVPYTYLVSQSHPDLYFRGFIFAHSCILTGDRIVELSSFSPDSLLKSATIEQRVSAVKSAFDSKNYEFIRALYEVSPRVVSPLLSEFLASNIDIPIQMNSESGVQFDHPAILKEHIRFLANLDKGESRLIVLLRFVELFFLLGVSDGDDFIINEFSGSASIDCLCPSGKNAMEYAVRHYLATKSEEDLQTCAGLIYCGIYLDYNACPSYYDALTDEECKEISLMVNHRKVHEESYKLRSLLAKTTFHYDRDGEGLFKLKFIYNDLFCNSDVNLDLIVPILRTICLDKHVEIHIDANHEMVEHLYAARSGQHGLTVARRNEIYIAAGSGLSDKDIKAYSVHEFTHFVCYRVWGNNCNPFHDGSEAQNEMEAIRKDLQNGHDDNPEKNTCVEILMEVFRDYSSEKYNSELIARVPEILLKLGFQDGLVALEQEAPRLLAFYRNHFLLNVNEYLEINEEADLQARLNSVVFPVQPPMELEIDPPGIGEELLETLPQQDAWGYSSLLVGVGIFALGVIAGVAIGRSVVSGPAPNIR